MDKTFRWSLFVTSFIPLWFSISLIDVWHICSWLINGINKEISSLENFVEFLRSNYLMIITLFLINTMMWISIISLNIFLKRKNNDRSKPKCKIIEAKHEKNLTADFILSYILPMVAFDFTDLLSVILFLIYFIVLAFVCIRNNNVYINFYFEIRKYKMYNCTVECIRGNKNIIYRDCIVLSKVDLTARVDQNINYWDFDNKIYLDISKE